MLTRMLVLWLLSERPLHGYRIKRILDDQGLGFWFSVEYAAVYSVLGTLVKEGNVETGETEQDAGRPPRQLYRITAAGRLHFAELVRAAWLRLPTTGDPFQLALAALPELTPDEVGPLREGRLEALRERLAACDTLERAAPDRLLVERTRALTTAEIAWLEQAAPGLQAESPPTPRERKRHGRT